MYKYVNVIISDFKVEIDRLFTYKICDEMFQNLEIGMRVIVPFGKKNTPKEGFVITKVSNTNIGEQEIKEIISIPDGFSLFNEEMLLLAKFMSEKYCAAISDALNIIMPARTRRIENKEKTEKRIKLSEELMNEDAFTECVNTLKSNKSIAKQKQCEVIRYLKECNSNDIQVSLSEILTKFEISNSTINTLQKHDIIEIYEYVINEDKNENQIINEEIHLTDEQSKIYEKIKNSDKPEFLLKGITGSGKTEIYIKLVENAIKEGKTGIILVPEIGLTGQMVNRFKSRFNNVSIMHSKLSPGEKFEEWKKVKDGLVDVVIGPRSAIFMPIENIGIIVIDEEHEMTYKSEITPKFDTIDIARFRREYNNAKLISASATPNIETYLKAIQNEIELCELKERYNRKPLPKVEIIDMKEELEKGNKSIFSVRAIMEIKERLNKNEQVIIFLNRRGFSTFVSCRKCGYVMKCPECNVPYVYHKISDTLECHYCFNKIKNVSICPNCNSKYIKYFGIGTEKIEQEIKNIFSSAKVIRMDADTTSRKGSQDELIENFKSGDADILVGTQMIAKGHNFPNVTLVCIIAADMMLNYQDFRASERTFQLITQVAGRAGRGEKEGIVLLQTYTPDNYAINLAANYEYEKFTSNELMIRKQLKYPPFSSLFYITFSYDNLEYVKTEIKKLKNILEYEKNDEKCDINILGPGEAAIGKLKNMYRWQVIIRSSNEKMLKAFAINCLKKYKEANHSSKVIIQINFD